MPVSQSRPWPRFLSPAHRTGCADFPHPAFGRDHAFARGPPGRGGGRTGDPARMAVARRPSCLPHPRRCAAKPVYASTTSNRSGSTPSLLHVTLSGLSAIGRGHRQSHPAGCRPSRIALEPGLLPSAGMTRHPRYYKPIRHPAGPACPSRGSGWCVPTTDRASRVAAFSLFHACRRHYPGGTHRCSRRSLPGRWQPSPHDRWGGFRNVRFGACSAFTRVAARIVAEPPRAALLLRSASGHVVASITRSVCFRPERHLPRGVRTRWERAPFHGALSCFVMRPLRPARKPTLSRRSSGCGRRPGRSGIGSHGWVPAFERVKKSDLSGFALAVRAHPVAPAPEPGSSLGSGGSFSSRSRSPPAAAVSGAMDGPRLRGRGDERRAPGRFPLPRLGGEVHGRPLHCVMFCHVPHAAAEALRFRSCISFPPLHPVPLHSVHATAGLVAPAAGPFLRAYPACAPVPASARLAPARFAHLIARARRRTHIPRPFPPGLFSAPAIASLRRNRDRGEPHGSTPPTPPCIRVRTRRFDGFKLRNGLAGRRGRACRRQPPGVRGRHAPYGLRSLGLRRSGLHPSPPAPRPVPTGCSAAWSA